MLKPFQKDKNSTKIDQNLEKRSRSKDNLFRIGPRKHQNPDLRKPKVEMGKFPLISSKSFKKCKEKGFILKENKNPLHKSIIAY